MTTLRRTPPPLSAKHAQEWQAACRATRYSDDTIRARDRVLRRFLDFVADIGEIDPTRPIAAHVTRSTVETYLHAAWDRGPKARFEDVRFLRETVLMLAPETDWSWLKDTVTVLRRDCNALHAAANAKPVPDRADVLAATQAHVAADRVATNERRALVHCRDAALVALVADTGLRIGTVARLRMRRHVSRQAGGWFVHVPGELTKTGEPERRRVRRQAGAVLDAYIAALPPLSAGAALWRTQTGTPLSAGTVKTRFPTAMRNVAGLGAGPHALRRAKGSDTTLDADSERAAMELGHTDAAMTRRRYVQATPQDVAPTAQAIVSPFA